MQGIIISDPLQYLPYYVRKYFLYGFVPQVLAIRVSYDTYNRLYHRIVCGRESVHVHTFSRNIRSRASDHICTLSRNGYAFASNIIRACASASILVRNSACLCVHAWSSVSIRARDSLSIHSLSIYYVCLSTVLSKINILTPSTCCYIMGYASEPLTSYQ